jgi:acyl dehydratase
MDLWYEELRVGYQVTSERRFVPKAEIIEFASKWDPQPFHLDEELSKESVFGQLVGCGTHTHAITMLLGVKCRVFTGNAVVGLGVDNMRYHAPVRPESWLSARFTVTSMRVSASKPGLGVVLWLAETSDDNDTLVFSGTFSNLYRRRPNGLV